MVPRRVLFVDFYSFTGGGQQNLLSVFKALDRRRWRPLLALPGEGPFADAARALDVPVFIVPMGKARWRRAWSAWRSMRGLKELMARERVDLVHANCYPANKLAAPAARALGLPVLWHKQIAVTQRPGSTTGRLWRFFSRFDDRVLAVSRQGVEGLAALGIPRQKIRLLYNNADVEALAQARPATDRALRALGLPTDRPMVLAAGMRRPHKGFDVLLQALALYYGRHPGARPYTVLLGDAAVSEPAHEALLRRLGEHPALKGNFKALPAQRPFAPWLKRAALFVSSSRWEGSPLVVIEAMAAGTPVLATRQASGEIVVPGRTGSLVESEDPTALARGLEEALAKPAVARRRAAAAKALARRRFSLKAYVRDLAALYEEMLAGKGGRP